MLRTLWNYPHYATFVMLAGVIFLGASFRAYGDIHSPAPLSYLPDINAHTMRNEELLETAAAFKDGNGMPGIYESSQNEMNIQWLEAGMTEPADYYEGNDAIHKLVSSAWKYYWGALTKSHPAYNVYTPVVTGNFSTQEDNIDYGIRFSLDSVKFRFEYAF